MNRLILFGFVALTACSGNGDQEASDGGLSPDSVPVSDVQSGDPAGDVPVLPALLVECASCHDIEALGQPVQGGEMPWSDWLQVAGKGLVRVDPAIPAPGIHLGLHWARRGVHPMDGLADGACAECHPVDAQGIGHGVRAYPSDAAELAFSGGQGCGAQCHPWLTEELLVAPFGEDGPSWEGSTRPADLLKAGDNAHSDLWKSGFSGAGKGLSLKIGQFRPGCGGCHNLAEESHGAMLSCLHCHRLTGGDGDSHAAHVAAITKGMGEVNPDGPDSACAYCHMDDDWTTVGKAACYNCHLSAHQPVKPGGGAHFFPSD